MKNVLVFDYDGVIVDSLSIFMTYFMDACKKEGYVNIATKKDFLQLFDGNMFEEMMRRGMNKKTIVSIVYTLREGLLKDQQKIKLFPTMDIVIKRLAKKHTLLISTSNETQVVSNYLKAKGLECFFEDIYGSDIEPSKVKKIELIKKNVPSNRYTYIGDTVGDMKECKQASIETVAATWGWHSKKQLLQTHPTMIADHPTDLLFLFDTESCVTKD
jgi:phosphoglycolate phosphatase